MKLLLLQSLVSRFGIFGGGLLLGNVLDDANSNCLLHVTDSKAPKSRVLLEGLHTHGLTWNHLHYARISRFDKLGCSFQFLTSSSINLCLQLRKLASNMGGVAIKDRGIASLYLTRVVQDNNLGQEILGLLGWVILGIRGDESSLEILNGNI